MNIQHLKYFKRDKRNGARFNPWRELDGENLSMYCQEKIILGKLKEEYNRTRNEVAPSFEEFLMMQK